VKPEPSLASRSLNLEPFAADHEIQSICEEITRHPDAPWRKTALWLEAQSGPHQNPNVMS
jgi:hypothetical protein